FSFYNSLPVPAPDVPYAEILDLKARRGPELHALREHLEKLYLSVINSNDIFRSQIVALRDLDASIATLARLMVESKLECLWQTLSVELLMEAGVGTATGAELAELGRQPVAYGAAAGLAGALYVFAKKRLKSVVSRAGPLAYLVHATHEEVIGSVRAP
ncbi:MAG TPA: DUF6236 family protein, partial [Steroidobacteraceae bacterium]|nr:DUF6236 family protein [Steroidobacteraceae bacterium]